jgi:hypothetical protein
MFLLLFFYLWVVFNTGCRFVAFRKGLAVVFLALAIAGVVFAKIDAKRDCGFQ